MRIKTHYGLSAPYWHLAIFRKKYSTAIQNATKFSTAQVIAPVVLASLAGCVVRKKLPILAPGARDLPRLVHQAAARLKALCRGLILHLPEKYFYKWHWLDFEKTLSLAT
jgi:hypothetical protein